MDKPRILVVSHDKLVQKSLYEMLCRFGYAVGIADSLASSLADLSEHSSHLILANIDEAGGLELLKTIKERSYPTEVIILTSYGNIEAAVDSIKLGAFDYLVRPVEDAVIISAIERALIKKTPAEPKHIIIKQPQSAERSYHGLLGKSPIMHGIFSIVERISNSKATILLRGESGTGKRLIAHAIHAADKKRRDKPFVEVSCGALPREIIESELFGHTKGAFTGAISDRKGRFELADGGTILLDDIDAFSPDLQVKLLRVLQQREFERVGDHKTMKVDVRIVAATNQDLEKELANKRFREDLFYRLNVISISLPPLRERKEDLPLLVHHFISLYAKDNHKKVEGIAPDTLDILTSYNWPGNIRELENIIERAVILDTDGMIKRDDLPEILIQRNVTLVPEPGAKSKEGASSLKDVLKEPEKVYILRVMEEVGWNKKQAARKLGVNRTTLYNKLRKYNLISGPDKK
jgi:DNA-binding NtrC family response regulator